MSYNAAADTLVPLPVSSFLYRNVGTSVLGERLPFFAAEAQEEPAAPALPPGLQQHEVDRLLAQARTEAATEVRRQTQATIDAGAAARNEGIAETLKAFRNEQKKYFNLAETEIVQLALAIAGRILHREAQVDPLLVAGLVRVAIEKLSSGSTVTVRVCPEQSEYWRAYRASSNNGLNVIVVEDSEMKSTDCILETELGSADFSIEAQLKEVEQGFCDLLALRPQA